MRGDGPLVLRRDGAADLQVPTEPQTDADGPLLAARFALAEALADVDGTKLELRLFAGSGRRATPVTYAAAAPAGPGLAEPSTRDRRWQFRVVDADGDVVIRRTRLPATVAVLGFTSDDRRRRGARWTRAPATPRCSATDTASPICRSPHGFISLAGLPRLASGATATFRVGAADVVRAGNALDRPMAGVALPPLPDPDVSLRWTRDGLLTLRREEAEQ